MVGNLEKKNIHFIIHDVFEHVMCYRFVLFFIFLFLKTY